jgi:hypothetical protein
MRISAQHGIGEFRGAVSVLFDGRPVPDAMQADDAAGWIDVPARRWDGTIKLDRQKSEVMVRRLFGRVRFVFDMTRVPDVLRKSVARALPLALLTLTACAHEPLVITRPVYIDRVQQVVQPIPLELLRAHAIAEGPPSACPSIAAQRRAELVACNADKAAIRAIVEPKGQADE